MACERISRWIAKETQINIKTTGNHVILLTGINHVKVFGLDLPLFSIPFQFSDPFDTTLLALPVARADVPLIRKQTHLQ